MHILRTALSFSLILLGIALWTACGGNASTHHHNTGTHDHTEAAPDSTKMKGKEYTSAYICPMHCEGSGSDQPGKCPVCKMDYVANDEHAGEGHHH